eukprot:11216-Eustigmatos_ZCMA.PRE.1
MASHLLSLGVDREISGEYHGTALVRHTAEFRPEVAEVLLRAGCNVDARNAWGQTAVFIAAMRGWSALTDRLIRCGADITISDVH